MAEVKFKATCLATYTSSLELPPEIDPHDEEQVLEYVRENLKDAVIADIEFMQDLENPEEAVDLEDLFIDSEPLITEDLKKTLNNLNSVLKKFPVGHLAVTKRKEAVEKLLPKNCYLDYGLNSKRYYVCHKKLGTIL